MKGMLIGSAMVLVVGVGGLFVLPKPGGGTWLTVNDFIPDTTPATGMLKQLDPQQGMVYRWRDASGSWHLSDTPPPSGKYETVKVNANANVIQGLSQPKSPAHTPEVSAPSLPVPMTLSPGKVEQLIEDAKGVQALSDERQKELQRY